jgi:Papain-like cysteine protease AvrRpt2
MDYKNLISETLLSPILREFKIADFLYWAKTLNFNMEAQTQSQWCWAATAKSVSHFYSGLSPWTQCKIASQELGETCCVSPVPGPCNKPWYLDKAFTRTNNFVSMQGGTASWETVRDELDKGLVVGARIGWSGGGGHFMVIHGVSRIGTTRYLHIDDPIYGKSILTVDEFSTNYQGSGSWTHTYFTQKYFYFMWWKYLQFNPVLLNPIPEIRPLLGLQNPVLNLAKSHHEIEISFPHHAYNLGLSSIGKEIELPKTPWALRVIEFEKQKPVALYDLSPDTEKPAVLQMNADVKYIGALDSGMERLKEAAKTRKNQGELKLLKVPGLNLEALWLNYEGKNEDLFYLVRHFEPRAEVMSEKAFHDLLRTLKTKFEKQDDAMGA